MNDLPPLNVPCWVKGKYVRYDTDGDSYVDFEFEWHVATRRLNGHGQSRFVVCTGNSLHHNLWEIQAWEPIQRPSLELQEERRNAQLDQKERAKLSIDNANFSEWDKPNPKTREIKCFNKHFGGVK